MLMNITGYRDENNIILKDLLVCYEFCGFVLFVFPLNCNTILLSYCNLIENFHILFFKKCKLFKISQGISKTSKFVEVKDINFSLLSF